ncbi:hypothetical protein Tco_0373309 [Tanacetum coccineum]
MGCSMQPQLSIRMWQRYTNERIGLGVCDVNTVSGGGDSGKELGGWGVMKTMEIVVDAGGGSYSKGEVVVSDAGSSGLKRLSLLADGAIVVKQNLPGRQELSVLLRLLVNLKSHLIVDRTPPKGLIVFLLRICLRIRIWKHNKVIGHMGEASSAFGVSSTTFHHQHAPDLEHNQVRVVPAQAPLGQAHNLERVVPEERPPIMGPLAGEVAQVTT